MAHTAIFGQTETGKTWLLKRRAKILTSASQRILVHSGTGDTDWPGREIPRDRNWPLTQIFFDAASFEEALANPDNYGSFVMVDEASVLFKQQATSAAGFPMIYNLGQMGRHYGYTCMFATQFPTALAHNVRVNCQRRYVFRLGSEDYATMVCKDAGISKQWASVIVTLPKLHFLELLPMQEPKRRVLT